MIKAVIFDFGNVICYFTNQKLVDRIAKISGRSSQDIFNRLYRQTNITKDYETGLISSLEFYEKILALCQIDVSPSEFKEIYTKDKFSPVEGTKDLIEKLKNNYKIGILSNTSQWDWDEAMVTAPFIVDVDATTLSYQVGAMKPDTKIFTDMLAKLSLKPEECVFTDDIEEYVIAAKTLGFQAFRFTTAEKLMDDLRGVGIKI